MTMPLVSVVLPTRDRARLVEGAVASVLEQDVHSLELVVVDDASQDDTIERLAAIDDGRLTVVSLPKPVGAAGARNIGIARSTGALIAFQDSDDEWLPAKLQLQVRHLEMHDLGGVGGRYVIEAGDRRCSLRPTPSRPVTTTSTISSMVAGASRRSGCSAVR